MMNMKKITIAIMLFWLILAGGFILSNQVILSSGKDVLLKVTGYDPNDLLRGEYVNLIYDINRANTKNFRTGQTVYVILHTDAQNIATAVSLKHSLPAEKTLFIKGKVLFSDEKGIIKYGIEDYFVKQGTGREIERKLRENKNSFAKVAISKDGRAKVKKLIY